MGRREPEPVVRAMGATLRGVRKRRTPQPRGADTPMRHIGLEIATAATKDVRRPPVRGVSARRRLEPSSTNKTVPEKRSVFVDCDCDADTRNTSTGPHNHRIRLKER